jgi:hypothetical protein
MIIHYDDTNAYLEFKNSIEEFDHNTKIAFGVYFAILMKQLRIQIEIPKLKEDSDINRKLLRQIEQKKAIESEKHTINSTRNITIDSDKDTSNDPCLLIKDLNEFRIAVTEIVGFGHFFGQLFNENSENSAIYQIQNRLNSSYYKLKAVEKSVMFKGMFVCTVFIDSENGIQLYRAKLVEIFEDYVEVSHFLIILVFYRQLINILGILC